MTTTDKNTSIGKSNSYMKSLSITSPKAYDFYSRFGNGDPHKGFIKSGEITLKLREDAMLIYSYVTEKGNRLRFLDTYSKAEKELKDINTSWRMMRQIILNEPRKRINPEKHYLSLYWYVKRNQKYLDEAKYFYDNL
jgi:hypothetical protein